MKIKDLITNLKIKNAEEEIKRWETEKDTLKALEEIKQEKYNLTKDRKKLSTTKLIMAFLFINCTILEIYSLVVMFILQDLSSLTLLLTGVVCEVISFAIYSIKATKENTKGGITYDLAIKDRTEDECEQLHG